MGKGQIPDWIRELYMQCYGSCQFDQELWRKAYQSHLLRVRDYFKDRKGDLLIVDICGKEGMQIFIEPI